MNKESPADSMVIEHEQQIAEEDVRLMQLEDDAPVIPASSGEIVEAQILEAITQNFHEYIGIARIRGVRTQQDAEDVAQKSFLKAWEHRDRFAGDRINGWMSTIVSNTARDMVRAATRRARYVEPENNELREWRITQVPSDFVIDREIEIEEMGKQLSEALASIPDEQRIVLELMYFKDLSYAEIADVLQIPMGTVKSRTNRGLEKMRRVLTGMQETTVPLPGDSDVEETVFQRS
jgi:RNA polymerase sigma-70 factor (ECF subfamily)